MKSFIESQFGYCRLILMFNGRGMNNKINHLHECSLSICYKDNNSSFKDLLKKITCLPFIMKIFNYLPYSYSRLKRTFRT